MHVSECETAREPEVGPKASARQTAKGSASTPAQARPATAAASTRGHAEDPTATYFADGGDPTATYFAENVASRVRSRGRAAHASTAAAPPPAGSSAAAPPPAGSSAAAPPPAGSASTPAAAPPTHDQDDLVTFLASAPVFPETGMQHGRVRYYVLWRGVGHQHLEGVWHCTWSHVSSHLPFPTLSLCRGINLEARDDLGDAIDLWRNRRRTASVPVRMA